MDEIVHAVQACPSGALSLAVDEHDGRSEFDQDRKPAIEVSKDGPYRITGGIPLLDALRNPVPRNVGASLEHYSLCRCGHSQNKPFCSGMHGYVEFHDPPLSDEPTLFEWAGGFTALRRMTHIFYEKHVPDDPLLALLFANMSPDHPERVAAWLGETSGGPERYTERYGGYDRMVSQHIGKDLSEDQRARWARHHAPRRRLARREDRGVRTLDRGRNSAVTDGEIHYHTTFRRAPHPTKEEPPDRRDNDRCVRHAELRVPGVLDQSRRTCSWRASSARPP